jgi:deferrochelatase/peroxidase EfeB
MTVTPSTATDEQPGRDEPELDLANIQGNILAGFKKDYQTLLYVHIDDAGKFKQALAELGKGVATAEAVRTYNLLYKQLRDQGTTTSIRATWMNIAFSFAAIKKLADEHSTVYFADQAFRAGLATSKKVEHLDTSGWKALDGNGDRAADVLIIIAADHDDDVKREVDEITSILHGHGGSAVVDDDEGVNPPSRPETEHFGYRDGISQPGLRGRATAAPQDLLTPRPFGPDEGKPGQELIWPGEFVFGYPGQVGSPDGLKKGGDSRYNGFGALQVPEEWGRDGSYLVFRRFDQDVYRFHRFLFEQNQQPGESGGDDDLPGARIVGRWRSGAPIMRTPTEDIAELGKDDDANNYFAYRNRLDDPPARRGNPGSLDDFPLARADLRGTVCPFSAHIRRANPRDDVELADRRQHRLLRRGIPFGLPSSSTPQAPVDDKKPRGLLFLVRLRLGPPRRVVALA